MAAPKSTLSALASLIVDAVKTVEEEGGPSYVVSLDDPTPHPLDNEVSSMEHRRAVQIIEGACAQLCATIARPNHTVLNKLMEIYEPACLRVVVKFEIPDVLLQKPEGMHVSEIAAETGIEVGKLGRVLRLLATKHFFREVTPDVFANNRLSVQLLSSNPLSSLALHFTDENNKSTALLADTLADPEWGHSYAPNHTPFNKYTGSPFGLFDYYAAGTPGAAERGARFGVAMLGWGAATEASAVVKRFPWDELPHGSTVCDVAGGLGHISLELAKAYPHLKITLQDSPARMIQAQIETWPAECPEALAEHRIEFESLDFFKQSPKQGCDIYYMKNIIHDWPDKECIDLLTNVRAAMAPNSRVLIQEYVLQRVTRLPASKTDFEPAPEPLLPNYGVGRVRQYTLDIDMLAMMNSWERRLDEFVELGEKAGLKFVKLWDLGEMGLMEFHLA